MTQENDGWIEWKGGECPVNIDTYIYIKCDDGEEHENRAGAFHWLHNTDLPGKIIAYKVPKIIIDHDYQPKPEDRFPEQSFNCDNWQNDAAQARAKGNLEWFYREAWVRFAAAALSVAGERQLISTTESLAANIADEMLEEMKKREF